MISKKLPLRCVILLSSVVFSGALSAQSWPSDSVVKATLQQRPASKPGVGIVVATLEKGKPAKMVTAGTTGSKALLDGNTVFEIGSVTKVFTTAREGISPAFRSSLCARATPFRLACRRSLVVLMSMPKYPSGLTNDVPERMVRVPRSLQEVSAQRRANGKTASSAAQSARTKPTERGPIG